MNRIHSIKKLKMQHLKNILSCLIIFQYMHFSRVRYLDDPSIAFI